MSHRDVERFDRRAQTYERGWRAAFHARVVMRSAEVGLQTVEEPGAVLDVGCGTGALLRELGERLSATVELVGIDPARAMIEVAQGELGELPNVRLEVAYAERLPFPDAHFDLIVSTVSFHHWGDQGGGAERSPPRARPGGRLLLVDHFATGWLRVFNAVARRNMRTARDLERLLEGARLAPLETVRIFDLGRLPLIQGVIAQASP